MLISAYTPASEDDTDNIWTYYNILFLFFFLLASIYLGVYREPLVIRGRNQQQIKRNEGGQ